MSPALVLLLTACVAEQDESPVVAQVGDVVLTRADLED